MTTRYRWSLVIALFAALAAWPSQTDAMSVVPAKTVAQSQAMSAASAEAAKAPSVKLCTDVQYIGDYAKLMSEHIVEFSGTWCQNDASILVFGPSCPPNLYEYEGQPNEDRWYPRNCRLSVKAG